MVSSEERHESFKIEIILAELHQPGKAGTEIWLLN